MPRKQHGFSLMENVLALVLLSTLVVGLLGSLTALVRFSSSAHQDLFLLDQMKTIQQRVHQEHFLCAVGCPNASTLVDAPYTLTGDEQDVSLSLPGGVANAHQQVQWTLSNGKQSLTFSTLESKTRRTQ